MTLTLERPATDAAPRSGGGGGPARRAMVRWAWRLFWREWRQQLLIVALIVVAVGATVVGAAVATDTPPPAGAGFGTAHYLATYPGNEPHLAAKLAALEHRVGPVDVIENQTLAVPGSVGTYQLRSQDPDGPYGRSMLALLSGHYPAAADQVALTPGLATELGLAVGDTWHQAGTARTVVGTVENPQSLLTAFALVLPGQVRSPTTVTVLFDAPAAVLATLGPNIRSVTSAVTGNAINPTTILLVLVTLGMLLIALVAVGGFTVLAQRRLRAIGMLGAAGATDRNIRLVVRANGVVVGVVGAVVGAVVGLLAWLAYRPTLEQSAHHLIGPLAVPWLVVGVAMVLAVVATYAAASRPARAITKVPIVVALSGRPAPPKQVHRSAIPGAIALVAGAALMTLSGSRGSNGGAPLLVVGLVALIVAIILLAPLCVALVARLAGRSPIAVRLALRDMSRYRSRSGSALGAISLGVMIAVIISVAAAGRYGNVLDYAGPNLASNQMIIYATTGSHDPTTAPTTASPTVALRTAKQIADSVGPSSLVPLESTNANLTHEGPGRNYTGPLYVATPQLLAAFHIPAASINPAADVLSVRPGFATETDMLLTWGTPGKGTTITPGGGTGPPPGTHAPTGGGAHQDSCPKSSCLANPVIQEVGALPAGTSAPNTVLTEHAVSQFHLQLGTPTWLVVAAHPFTANQITDARRTAAAAGMSIETRNSAPSSSEIIDWATVFGVVLALAILAMSVGLIRSETAADLQTLTATGATSGTRRTITAATAGALGLLGAVLGTVTGYLATAAWFRGDKLTGGLHALANIPVTNLAIIVVGMPLLAAVVGWVLAGREPSAIAGQPMG